MNFHKIRWIFSMVVVLLAFESLCYASSRNSLMQISRDGKLLVCTNRDNGTVSVVDLKTQNKRRELPAGKKPEGVTFLGKSHRIAVASYETDEVIFLDADSGKRLGHTAVFDEPYGVVSNRDGSKIYVTLDFPGRIVEIDTKTFKILHEIPAGIFTRGIAISHDDSVLYITEYYTSNVKAFRVNDFKQVDAWNGISTENLSRQITLHPTRPKAYLAHIRSKTSAAQGAGSIFPYLTVIDTGEGEGRRRKRIPMDSFISTIVTANPWDVAVSSDGLRVYMVFSGTNDMFVCDFLDDNYREIKYRKLLRLGHNPRAVCVSPDNETFYIYNAIDFEVVAYSSDKLQPIAKISVCDNPLGEKKLLGKRLFYAALQPMVGRRWISCSSCHPDGQADGRTWQNPEGLRNTQSLAGLAWTHPIHWSADRDEVQDFEHTIRGELMQGRGLVRGKVFDSLGKPNRGLSKELDALAAYSNSHNFTLSPFAKKGLSESAKRGKEIFFSKQSRCTECHSGPFYSDSVPREIILRHNVGTGTDDPSEKMGPKFDTPTLLGIYRTAPYLHHGKAASLEDLLTTHNKKDQHGHTSQLSEKEIANLVSFLKSLPYEDPVPLARQQKMKQVVD